MLALVTGGAGPDENDSLRDCLRGDGAAWADGVGTSALAGMMEPDVEARVREAVAALEAAIITRGEELPRMHS